MKLGAYTACLQDRPLREALTIVKDLGLTSAEINAGGFVPAPHLPIGPLLESKAAREDYLGQFEQAGIALTGLNVNGNPLNPDPEVGQSVADGVGDRRVRADGAPFADTLETTWIARGGGLEMGDLDHRNVGGGREQVVQERRSERVAVVVVHEVLVQRAADSLRHPARDLPFDDHRVDHHTTVFAHDVAQDRYHTGRAIDLDGARVARVRPRERRSLERRGRFEPGLHALGQACSLQVRDASDLAPLAAMADSTGIWFSDYRDPNVIRHWQQGTGLRNVMVTGLPAVDQGSFPGAIPTSPCF